MNRKRIALLTGLTLFTGVTANNAAWSKNTMIHAAEATQAKGELDSNQRYPDITKKLDLTSMDQYTSDNLFMNVTLKKFYIKNISVTKDNQNYLILAPIKTSNQYFLLLTKANPKFKINQRITVQGFLNGKSKITTKQINNGLEPKYLNKKVVSIMADNIIFN
ncbi:hypothetical protein FD29_GL001572 [Companilactobacillus mindensis DSM 14500]|uniref:Uncharacterized protein n=1 Tax=Companilactobacillus mindensis DSM 14500 TaxID=1423770 RepID=A0A0R1QE84_9LACO|nr:hypothetical protein [Companilactobacillus mindensis]KRL42702.1 hypothetical protein FD29_GL001572 [Companilactobacillus mindensis DSM 14500]GEO78518.1 hypothetical protein LMI01_08490 [Companilactobacillus mindensis]